MSVAASPLLGIALLAVATALVACQSTQDKSREIAESLGPVAQEKGLVIKQRSKDVEVLETTLLEAKGETAVVVTVRNKTDRALRDVPILIDVVDSKGKSVYRNDIPGIETALASIPILQPNERLDWVHNQVLAIGRPKEVKVTVGATDATAPATLPEIEVEQPQLANDPVSGINARGRASNRTGEVHERLLIYGVARRGGEIVAAGRAAIDRMKPDKRLTYFIFFVGDPSGADLTVTSFPTLQAR